MASQLPSGAAIYRRADSLDDQIYSLEAQLLRTLINMKIERKSERIPTADEASQRAEKEDRIKHRREAVAREVLARMRQQREAVSDG